MIPPKFIVILELSSAFAHTRFPPKRNCIVVCVRIVDMLIDDEWLSVSDAGSSVISFSQVNNWRGRRQLTGMLSVSDSKLTENSGRFGHLLDSWLRFLLDGGLAVRFGNWAAVIEQFKCDRNRSGSLAACSDVCAYALRRDSGRWGSVYNFRCGFG